MRKAFASGNVDGVNWDDMKPWMTNIAKDIKVQKERIGGDFVVAQAVTSRDMRDHIRKTLPDCTFITLSMTRETQVRKLFFQSISTDFISIALGHSKTT